MIYFGRMWLRLEPKICTTNTYKGTYIKWLANVSQHHAPGVYSKQNLTVAGIETSSDRR